MFNFRLPIIQGGTFAFLAPAVTILSQFNQPAAFSDASVGNMTQATMLANVTDGGISSSSMSDPMWQEKMRLVSHLS